MQPLSPGGPLVLTCPAGHNFDVNKRGFLSALGGSRGLIGDSAEMLDARESFLSAGWFEPLRDSLAALVSAEAPSRVLDVGCGTGYYLRGVLAACPAARALGLDISPAAVLRTVRGDDRIDGLVADVWSPLPVRDAAADVILTVFAPRNPVEFHRVLRPQGLLAVVIPQSTHLRELREAGLALDVQTDKAAQLREGLAPWFDLESRSALSRTLSLSPAEVRALIGMGPSAHHAAPEAAGAPGAEPWTVTTAFEVIGFRRRPG
ncbi:methyltransferase domain-containing protein [Cryobacterium tagatosivorans]|uniref:methyltransferase domain-containing protein n=1 Tax=Cryobacterium tagatosivorans TaxID=1259199 RepID=UPI00141AF910|nr:methyltransferase domain-containing protein [Cryobacterium tagatosivorans]